MNRQKIKQRKNLKRQLRVRRYINGNAERPRLTVRRSLNHIYAQLIDDDAGKTLAAASTLAVPAAKEKGGNVIAAKLVGELLGERALQAGIKKAVFDRGPYRYHGRIKALAEGARSKGLQF